MGSSKFIHEFVHIDLWISLSWILDLPKLFYVFLAFCQTKPGRSLARIVEKLLFWTDGVEWIKALNAFAGITSKCIWARNKGGNDFYCFTFDGSQVAPKDNLVPKKTTHRLLRQPGQPPDGGSWPCPWSSCQWSEPTQDQASHFGIGGEKPREAGPPPSPGRTRGNHCQAFVHN